MPILDLHNNIILKSVSNLRFKFNQESCTTCLSNFVYDESSMKNSILILECNHVFHLTCTITYIKHKLAENVFNIKCPLCNISIKKNFIIKILNTYNNTLIKIKKELNQKKIKSSNEEPSNEEPSNSSSNASSSNASSSNASSFNESSNASSSNESCNASSSNE